MIVALLILEVPLSIAPKPEVIDPESKAPVVTQRYEAKSQLDLRTK